MSLPQLRTLLRGRRVGTTTVMTYALAVLAWLALIFHDAVEQVVWPHNHAMRMGTTTPGAVETAAVAGGLLGVAHYLLMWGLMMVAMMYPSSAGAFQWYADRRTRTNPGDADRAVAAFVGTYTLVWTLAGLLPLAVNAVVPLAPLASTWGPLYLGVALFAVAAFQLSPVKQRALCRCRAPADLLDGRSERSSAAQSGWAYGRQDLAACGVPMALMVVVGSMNLVWMALITIALSVERLVARGELWARASGLLAAAVGVVLVAAWLR